MDLYSLMRQFADSWALLALVLVFLGVLLWVFRPGSAKLHEDAAASIFRHDRRPAPPQPEKETL
ncbi:CcoQ/FixQ family Cbb3-type cytochrome c oxidase assembly chaperone [Paracoccus xiamenensis]|uniref:CcoQ/FixQ family Cbb3-type cytochrome c oxidase assembly chaperone n=1 Tax=Paracoccus xiamenensis TaxID=2714901 RepID=UPI00140CA035|nr:CcoQ/FixQ family Cbb3-type cytochrome c oxidase assembly chaperone [Paracoccus xiamenensis]NHF72648.1 CcoQ/FixQ family Cbb3-type cytochrome c oxidase assembly chaperone [Paracoccus xiamenensis]